MINEYELLGYLDALVDEIQDQHNRETESWSNDDEDRSNPYCLKNRRVCEIDSSIRGSIISYRKHLISDLVTTQYLDRDQGIFHIECRVKATNSIDEKVEEYLHRAEKG